MGKKELAKHGMLSSMGQVGNCYENALAEGINGILKIEYGLGEMFVDRKMAKKAVREAVKLYNNERPHLSLNYRTPAEVHHQSMNRR